MRLLLSISLLMAGCADYDVACNSVPANPGYDDCCCELVDTVFSKYGGGYCSSLSVCHDAGFYFPGVADYDTPDYSVTTDWVACPEGFDPQYDATCEGGGFGSEECAAEITGVWAATFSADVLSDATDEGVTCSTSVATTGFTLYFGFAGTDDSGRAVGVFSGEGDIASSAGGASGYETLLNPDTGYRYASATLTDGGWVSIEIYTDTPSSDGTCATDLLSVVWAYVDPASPDAMVADFSRDPAYGSYETSLACNPLGFHDVTFAKLDGADPDVAEVLASIETIWDQASAECNAGILTECAESSTTTTDGGTAGPPPPSNASEFVAQIPPIDMTWFPAGGHYGAAFTEMGVGLWVVARNPNPNQWSANAHGAFDTLFVVTQEIASLAPAKAALLNGGLSAQTDWNEVRTLGHWFIERLSVDPIRRGAIDLLVNDYLASDRGTQARAKLDWGVFQTFLSTPRPSAPPVGLPPAPPPNPPVQ